MSTLARRAAPNYGIFSRADTRALGITDSALGRLVESGQAERLLPNVFRLTSVARSWHQNAKAATVHGGEEAWLSHRSAAYHLGILDHRPDVIEVVSRRDVRSRPGFKFRHVQRILRSDVRTVKCIPVTDPFRTLIDLAAVLSVDRLEATLDDALWRGFVIVPRLLQRLDAIGSSGRKGTRALRELLAVRDDGCAVPLNVLERRFLKIIRGGGLEEPEKQVPMKSDGPRKWRLDFVYPHHKVIIEVDGGRWHAGRQRQKRDRRRDNVMNVRGWTVLRFTWEDVMYDPAYVIRLVKEALGIHQLS